MKTKERKIALAVLDGNGYLVGVEQVDAVPAPLPPDRVVVDPEIDLPLNGSYKWDPKQGSFLPLGAGFGPLPAKPPIGGNYALHLVIAALEKSGFELPRELQDWQAWYRAHGLKRDEERSAGFSKRKRT